MCEYVADVEQFRALRTLGARHKSGGSGVTNAKGLNRKDTQRKKEKIMQG